MKNKYLVTLLLMIYASAFVLILHRNTLDLIERKSMATVEEVNLIVKPYEAFLTPTPSASPTPTVTPTPLPTLSPTPTPICLMSNQEYYNECVARGLVTPANDYDDRITVQRGGYMGPSGRETYYNLNMSLCVAYMRDLGYDEIEYPYWIRDDGAKMLGNYVMCAANWSIRPKGTILETSLGDAIVVDTGDFVLDYPYGVDLAVDW
jgi:hypothetical protein